MTQIETNLGELAFQAADGDAEAQYCLGIRFLLGESVEQDLEAAYQWLAKAACGDYRDAQILVEELGRYRAQLQGREKSNLSPVPVQKATRYLYGVAARIERYARLVVRGLLSRLRKVRAGRLVIKMRFQPPAKAWECLRKRRGVSRITESL